MNQGVTLTLENGANIIKGMGSTITNNGTINAGCAANIEVDGGTPAVIADHTYENGKCTVCGKYEDGIGAHLAGHSLSLNGRIGVNFYMELDDSVIADDSAYMQFTLPSGETTQVYVKDISPREMNGKNYYVFQCEVAAMEMTDTITAQMKTATAEGTVYTYTVKDYADYLFENKDNNTEYAKAAELIRSMVDYGTYAQIYANHNTDKPASDDLTDVSGVTVPEYVYTANANETNVKFEGSNLSLLSATTLRMFFSINNVSPDDVSFTYNGTVLEKTKSGQYYYVELTDIPAGKLDDDFIVTVNDGTNTFDVEYSPKAYCYNVVSREETAIRTPELKNLIKALWRYNSEANKYFEGGTI